MDNDKQTSRARGERTWLEVVGFPAPAGEMSRLSEVTLDLVMNEIWNAPGLSRRERRLVTISVLAARAMDTQLGIHINAAIKSGDLDRESIDALAMHLAVYGGWPVGSQVSMTAAKHFAETPETR